MKSVLYLSNLLESIYILVFLIDLAGVFQKSPTKMLKSLMLMEIVNTMMSVFIHHIEFSHYWLYWLVFQNNKYTICIKKRPIFKIGLWFIYYLLESTDLNTFLILWSTIFSTASLAGPKYFLGSKLLGFSEKASLIDPVTAILKSVSTLILHTL